ncbi:MAG: hypothetical protein NTV23_02635 [Propionibacteriales bacterium]|nr:hypothetical protein [Propionibacteriales bacterium]
MADVEATPEPAAVRTWLSRAGAAALVVLGAQFLWRTILLGQGYFSQDDFLTMASTTERHGLSALTGDYAGGFSPGGSAIVRASVDLAPLNWTLAAGEVLLLQAAATAMLWIVLTQVLGERWLRLPLLVMFAFSPLTLWSTQWWVLGLELWGATFFLLVALWAALGAVRTGDRRRWVVVVAAVAAALLFDERAVLAPVVVLGVLAITASAPTVRARVATVLADQVLVWVALVLVLAGYAVLRWQVAPLPLEFGSELGDVVTGYLRHSIAEVLGGPWTGNLPATAYLIPFSWTVALSGALLLALVGFSTQYGGPSARLSWALLVVFVAGSVGVLAVSGRADLVASLGLIHRFGAEVAVVAVLCLAGALRDITFPDLTHRGYLLTTAALERTVAVASSVALVASAAVTTGFLASNLYHSEERDYVDALRSGLRADPAVVLLDTGVPDEVISTWYGARATVSHVIGVAPENPVFDLPSHTLRIVREDGSLAPVVLDGPVETAPSQDKACGYPVRAAGVLVPMQAEVPAGRWVLRIGYYTSADGFATLLVAGSEQRFAVRSGLHAIDVVVNGGFVNFRMTLDDPVATLCLTNASAGVPRPEGR